MAKAAASLLIAGLGSVTAFTVIGAADADEPIPYGAAATVYRTLTETRTVNRRLEGHTVGWWRARAIANRREANQRRITLRRIRRFMHARWEPTVSYGLALARTVYGLDLTRRARCESNLNPFAQNPSGATGLLQFLGSTWRTTPFAAYSMFDPVAQALAGGWMVSRGRSNEWTCGL